MDTITTYIENVFKSLPQTDEVMRIKTQLLEDMEAKYLELREGGTSEHEAVAKVIGDFGNIDELLEELDIPTPQANAAGPENAPVDPEKDLPIIPLATAREFFSANERVSRLIAIGVTLILVGVAGLFTAFALASLFNNDKLGLLGVIAFLCFVAVAVGLFIYSNSLSEKYHYIEKGRFKLEDATKHLLSAEYNEKNPRITMKVAIGVGLCIFGAIVLIASIFAVDGSASENVGTFLGLTMMMLIIAAAVHLFIRAAGLKGAYDKLLKQSDYTPERQEADKVVGAVAAIYWPIVVCIFLIWGFVFDGWQYSWITYPIAGLLFAGFAGLYQALKGAD